MMNALCIDKLIGITTKRKQNLELELAQLLTKIEQVNAAINQINLQIKQTKHLVQASKVQFCRYLEENLVDVSLIKQQKFKSDTLMRQIASLNTQLDNKSAELKKFKILEQELQKKLRIQIIKHEKYDYLLML